MLHPSTLAVRSHIFFSTATRSLSLRIPVAAHSRVSPRMSSSTAAAAAAGAAAETRVIDGSLLEGGGQILRNAVAYGAVLSRPVEVRNVRANRSKPGLRAQHLTGLRLAAEICGGRLRGDEIGSTSVLYDPPPPGASEEAATTTEGRSIVGDTGTAGSICLLLQTALPCALFAPRPSRERGRPVELELRGGTNADMAPQVDYLTEVFLPVATGAFGLPRGIDVEVERRGYYPRGGGVVRARVPPATARLRPVRLTERGRVCDVRIRSFHAGKVPRWVAQRMADSAVRMLRREGAGDDAVPSAVRPSVEVATETSAVGSGSGILVVARTTTGCLLAGSALGRPKVKADRTGEQAARELVDALRDGGCVDEWLQDQLILFMALADGESEVLTGGLTLHTRTAIMVAEELTGAKFNVERLSGGAASAVPKREESAVSEDDPEYGAAGRIPGQHRIRCKGIGFLNRQVEGVMKG